MIINGGFDGQIIYSIPDYQLWIFHCHAWLPDRNLWPTWIYEEMVGRCQRWSRSSIPLFFSFHFSSFTGDMFKDFQGQLRTPQSGWFRAGQPTMWYAGFYHGNQNMVYQALLMRGWPSPNMGLESTRIHPLTMEHMIPKPWSWSYVHSVGEIQHHQSLTDQFTEVSGKDERFHSLQCGSRQAQRGLAEEIDQMLRSSLAGKLVKALK